MSDQKLFEKMMPASWRVKQDCFTRQLAGKARLLYPY